MRHKNRNLNGLTRRSSGVINVMFDPNVTTDEKLEALGLQPQLLYDSILYGEAARASCTTNDPSILPGILAWGRTLRALGESLAPLGWVRRNEGNYSTVVDRRLGIAIAVATGDEATGLRGAIPRTKYPKGPTTQRAVTQNNQQLDLFEGPADVGQEVDVREDRVALTWILLIARIGDEVRCELSLPAVIGEDDRVEGWRERIILDPIRVAGASNITVADLELTPEIDIPVTVRSKA
jgi:hypothetical protein